MQTIPKKSNNKTIAFKDLYTKECSKVPKHFASDLLTYKPDEENRPEDTISIYGELTGDILELYIEPSNYPTVNLFTIDFQTIANEMADRERLSISMSLQVGSALMKLFEQNDIFFSQTEYGLKTDFIKLEKSIVAFNANYSTSERFYLNIFKLRDQDVAEQPTDQLSHLADIL